ncbi:phosphotransferase [Bacillus sp. AFS029533]|uniref:phosphotransferase enzyme family protein n=1 Tax=Bacillus sp. AFS029533 TaxID=2033494 RepID=UPI000BFE1A47|nr:phosphotransferase [Bacillus sp. AFS029533]PGZ91727.1 aminoglycoside phosphotransferase [Bacillus sp. AFS029533]
MEQAVERVFTKEILTNAAAQFGITVDEKPVGEFENYLFKGKLADGTDRILRLTHSSHRSKEEIEAELKFLKYARENGANAAGSLTSLNGNLVEVQHASDGTSFYASMFEWADGQLVDRTNPAVWNDDLMYAWGKTIGKLHALTVDYPVTNLREHWDEEAYLNEMLADEELGIFTKDLIEEIQAYERKKDSYGLIHSDLHLHNFFLNDKGEITAFDFDDLQYNYFISDIAIVLYYTAWGSKASFEEKSKFAKRQLEIFRKGYETEYVLDEEWYSRIPSFLKCRDLTLYHVLNMKYEEKTQRVIELCEELKERIVNKKTIIDL